MSNTQTVASLGENLSLMRVIERLRKPNDDSSNVLVGPGDDSAVLAAPDGRFCVTTDTMIEGHDFKLEWSSAYDLGWKAVATNAADVAAMGAVPTSLVIAMGVPSDTEVRWLEGFVDGANAACETLAPRCFVVGGDLAASDKIFIAVTAFGDLQGREPVLRSGAQVGDVVAVGGTLGRAACGLALLQSGNSDAINTWDDWVNIQRRPEPPIELGVIAAQAGATSMLDISDGLAKDAARIAKASQVSIALSRQALQGYEAVLEGAASWIDADAFAWVLGGGEDHSLLATFAADATLPRGFKRIGEVTARAGSSGDDSALASQSPGVDVLLDGTPVAELGWDSVSS